MELKEKNTEDLKSKFSKGKRLIQILTIILVIVFGFYVYALFTSNEYRDSYSLIIISLMLIVVFYDKKIKKVKAELGSRE